MKPYKIWIRAQITGALLMLPAIALPPLYLFLVVIQLVAGLPAMIFYFLMMSLIKHFLSNRKPVTKWVAALACLPGMLLITGGCVLIGVAIGCNLLDGRIEWELSLFGLPAMIGIVIAVCIGRKDIHCFIYPHLYASPVQKDTLPPVGMVYPQPGTPDHTQDY